MDNLIKILEKLVSFRTVSNDLEENKRALIWIEKEFNKQQLSVKKFENNNYQSLLATTKKNEKLNLLLAAHVDVVPGSEKMFKIKRSKGKIFGRGVFDMKYAIACYLKFINDFKNILPNLNFDILITSDEEMGGFLGTKNFVDKGYKPSVCLLPDGGSGWRIIKEAKGIWVLKIKSYGRSAHSSKLWLGKNANLLLINFLNDLQRYFQKEPCGDRIHRHATMSINIVNGGSVMNQVPDYSEALLDIRFLNDQERYNINSKMTRLRKKYKGIKIENMFLEDCFNVDTSNKYFKVFIDVIKKHKINKRFMLTHGSSDARHFVKAGIPTIVLRPKGGAHHTENEWIDEKDMVKFYKVLKDFVLKVGR